MPTEQELIYLAGLIDGEGCFCIERTRPSGRSRTPSYVATVGVEMGDVEPLEVLKRCFGGWTGFRTRKTGWKSMHSWKACSRVAEKVIHALLPYLTVERKKRAARACLGLLGVPANHMGRGVQVPDEILKQRQYFYELCREANRRGEVTV